MNQSNRRRWLVVAAGAAAVALYLGWAALDGALGFPLDDAWIHQTYARNLAQNGRLSFASDAASAGSTAPLWTILLAVGYALRLPYLLWAYLLGWLSLLGVAWSGMRLWRQLWPEAADADWLAGIVLAGAWPLVWAAASGMETLLFAALGLFIVSQTTALLLASQAARRQVFWLGLAGGLLMLVRPDGLVLLLLALAGLLLRSASWAERLRVGGVFVLGALLPLLPYFAFHWLASGSVWPNTFYAKQTEYAVLQQTPLLRRLVRLLLFSLGGPEDGWRGMSGAHLLLLPGLLAAAWRGVAQDWRLRRAVYVLPLLWAGGHILLYAWRLPVTFQHGRYLMAALPVWILFGLAGWRFLLLQVNGRAAWVLRQTAGLTFAGIVLLFLGMGARAYATDVAFIENEMVAVAHWLAANTPQDAVVAAHDIGAIGYFAQRPLLDLAGLVSPEVIPLLNDETGMAAFVLNGRADYLVTAPGWPYERIVASPGVREIFTTDYDWTRENGLNNMTVYLLKSS